MENTIVGHQHQRWLNKHNVINILFAFAVLRHLKCPPSAVASPPPTYTMLVLVVGRPSIHPSTLISTQYVQTVDTNTMKDGFQKEGIKRPIS